MKTHGHPLRTCILVLLLVGSFGSVLRGHNARAESTWIHNGSGWWYQHTDGSYPAGTWEKIDGSYYYFDGSGYMVSNCWIGNYYLGGSGAMLKNTTTPDGYRVDQNGKWIPTNRWIQNGNGWWYQHADGSYPAGTWEKIDGNYYYFDGSGYMVSNCWIGNYYLGASGAMLKNTTTPDGYQVDQNGKWIPNAAQTPQAQAPESAPTAAPEAPAAPADLGNLPRRDQLEQARVVRVVDGDTIVVNRGRGAEKVRLILVDTPETVHPRKAVQYYGKEASNFTKSQLTGTTVYLEKDVSEYDRYHRLLRYVWTDIPNSASDLSSKCFNAVLVQEGYAQVYTFPPDLKYVNEFRALQTQARSAHAGLWGNPDAGSAPHRRVHRRS